MDNKLYRAISRRRVSCSVTVQQLWDAIMTTCYQRQQPSLERIAKYMVRVHGMSEDEVRRQIIHCVRDGLLKQFKRVGIKGKMAGVEQEGYQIPTQLDPPHDGHDWYCFECHNSGDVICCTSCHRVYHLACLPATDPLADDVKNTFVCPTCKACASEGSWASRKDLNRLLIHTCERLKERLPLRLTDRQVPSKCSYVSGDRSATGSGGKGSFTWVVDEEQQWRVDFLLYRTVDIASMESKARQRQYSTLAEFEADAATIVHNVVIYHGVNSIIADMSRQMLRDCLYDLAEMRQCKDCYRRSNEKTNKNWFCLPCNPTHMLVYAKQKGYPYWPAKVIRVEDDMYDVRFFGAPHERAKLEKTHIRDITVNLAALGVKRSAGFNKACEELRRHQQLLAQGPRANSPMSSSDEAGRDDKGQNQPQRTKRGRQKSEKESEEEESDSEKSPPAKRKRVRKSAAETPAAAVPKRRGRRSTAAGGSMASRKSAQKQKPADGEDAEDESSGDEESVSSTSQQHVPSKEDDDQVSSSCTVPRSRCVSVQTPPRFNREEAPRKRRQSRDKDAEMAELRRECEREKAAALAVATHHHELELERVQNEYNQELVRIEERHRIALTESKRKQWCYNCEAEAIYHCCWNTAYCSTECQQSHWHKEHKRLCRRKR